MSRKNLLYLFNAMLISLILFACGTPGTEISSAPELEATSTQDKSSESITEEPSEPSPTLIPTSTNTPEPSPTPAVSQEDLILTWRPTIAAYFLVDMGCKFTEEMLLEFKDSGGGEMDKLGAIFAVGIFMSGIDEVLNEWEPIADMQTHKDSALTHLESVGGTVGSWSEDELSDDEAIDEISIKCQSIEAELEDIGSTARQAGLTEENIEGIGLAIEDAFTEFLEGRVIEEGEEETPISTEGGMSRANPFPIGETHSSPNWDIQVLESIRGDEAWQMIQELSSYNEPPAEGMEYILIKIKAISTYEDSDEHNISDWDFKLTGSNLIRYEAASVVGPDPGLDATLYTGGETDGWISFEERTDEDNIILIFDESANWEEDRFRFFVVEEGASISIDQNLSQIQPTDLGVDRSSPAPFGETVITEEWEVAVKEVIRGDEAWQMIQSTSSFNDPPEEGMEYVLAKVWVRNIGTSDSAGDMDSISFKSTGSSNTLYDMPSVVEPEPELDVDLFSGGVYVGWLVLFAAEGETNLMAVFSPWTDWDDTNRRFIALE